MEVEILQFQTEQKGNKKGYVDFKVTYSTEQWEIFRNVAVFSGNGKRWLSYPATKRDDKWIPIYERAKPMKDINEEVFRILKNEL